jgi:hypothetical protein
MYTSHKTSVACDGGGAVPLLGDDDDDDDGDDGDEGDDDNDDNDDDDDDICFVPKNKRLFFGAFFFRVM